MIRIKVACTIIGIALIILNSILSGLFCADHPKAQWLFCVIGGLLGFTIIFVW